jgi:hypothetical protein
MLAVIIKTSSMKHYYFLFSIFLFGCSEKKDRKPIDASKVIISATLLKFEDLNDSEKADMIFDDCCCYPKNWNQGENCIEKENAFYVKAKINNNLLSYISESDAFPRENLLNENPHFLYGKYRNRWNFINEKGNPICETSKFEGHNSFKLSRLDSIDSIIIGPLPEKPKEMIIEILDSKNYPELIPKCKVQ